jgi:hypothetical protein
MHPDDVIAALRRERKEITDPERLKSIDEQIAYADEQKRPTVKPESSSTVAQPTRVYYDALRQELVNAPTERQVEIQVEIDRVAAELPGVEPAAEDDLEAMSRNELNALAAEAGVENPGKLPNKEAVIAAIGQKPVTTVDLPQLQIDTDAEGNGTTQLAVPPEGMLEPTLLGELVLATGDTTPCEGTVTVTSVEGKPQDACVSVAGAPPATTVVVQYTPAE